MPSWHFGNREAFHYNANKYLSATTTMQREGMHGVQPYSETDNTFDVGVPSISLFRGDFTLYVSYTIAHFRWLLNEEMLKT